MDTKRLILFVIFSASTLMLWDAWQRQHAPAPQAEVTQTTQSTNAASAETNVVPTNSSAFKIVKGQRVQVKTDVYAAEIDTTGGDLRHLTLLKHRADDSDSKNFVLMDDAAKPMLYIAQTGFRNTEMPNDQSVYSSTASSYAMKDGENKLDIVLSWQGNGVSVNKIYTFHRNSYVIDVRYQVSNASATILNPTAYFQMVHDNQSKQGSIMMPTFTGGAYYTETDHFNKISFEDMSKSDLSKSGKDGWAALIQHYFASAWILKSGTSRTYYTKQLNENDFAVGFDVPMGSIAAGAQTEFATKLYAGPQIPSQLEAAAPGLDLVVDYGWLTIIAKPLFILLSWIHQYVVSNWGVAIIILTILIKAAFFKLSASGYRNMAHLRELAPKLQAMKERFGDDKQKMQEAMMDLYRKEKINPMGGCLPILVQIPVFIALYWVLMGAVELRHAPFFGWIKDLSAMDPYYVLPIIMGASMIVQTKLNPTPTDPIQAKVMMIMPIVFSVFFLWFPAGLVLYWLVNNILSIWQQWYINKTIHAEAVAKKSGGKR